MLWLKMYPSDLDLILFTPWFMAKLLVDSNENPSHMQTKVKCH